MGAALPKQAKDSKTVKPRPQLAPARRRVWIKISAYTLLVTLAAAGAAAVIYEVNTSHLQAKFVHPYAQTLTFALAQGASPAIVYPKHGPFDQRLGYATLPMMLDRLMPQGYDIAQQVRFSQALMRYTEHGLYPPYPEKNQAGLSLTDCRGESLYHYQYPKAIYQDFAAIAPLIVNTLVWVENRHLLDTQYPHANPAVDWPRLVKASLTQAGRALEMDGQAAGGSTLATQIEKYRHSDEGRTQGFSDKARQMLSATVRSYQLSDHTLEHRQRLVRDYLNSVPLAAAPGHGEVNGLADGLEVWFGADFSTVNQLLSAAPHTTENLSERAQALRQVLALIIAQRRPSWYLNQGREALESLINSHLRLLTQAQIVTPHLRDAALNQATHFRNWQSAPLLRSVHASKSLTVTRNRLSQMLGVGLYDLDRLDLAASTTLDVALQEQIGAYLKSLSQYEQAAKAGLLGERLLRPAQLNQVRYSFTLFENTEQGARVRVQTDNTEQPFDLNEGSKLELGSTAKLRVLTTYLQMVAELYQRFSGLERRTLQQFDIEPHDALSLWAQQYLLANPNADLTSMLRAALNRRYSASPYETFFTGGGLHRFNNFQKEDNARNPTLNEALRESINLPFVRLMRDLVRYSLYQSPNNSAALLKNDQDPRRAEYLQRFADREGRVFMQRFWRKYQQPTAEQRLDVLLKGLSPTPTRLAAVYRYLYPAADLATFSAFITSRMPAIAPNQLTKLYHEHRPGRWTLPDQGYLAGVHPLELWLAGYLINQPDASLNEVLERSSAERQEVYSWLFKTRHKGARDSRIRTLLEVEAFSDIHQRWQQLGYPFSHLVPSLATALGSSGDRPAALAELIGIIQNQGIRQPSVRIDQLNFAVNTPYQTHVLNVQGSSKQVMPIEVAKVLSEALAEVARNGTARRVQEGLRTRSGEHLVIGGKTGTGDNRIQKVAANGQVLSSTALNRTATFVFYIGERYYGTLTAFVEGKTAADFAFTSALPVQVLKSMTPILAPALGEAGSLCRPPQA